MPRKEVLVQLTDELVEGLDGVAADKGTSRSSVVREAVQQYMQAERNKKWDRLMREGYERFPQTQDELEMARESLQRLLDEESW